MAQSRSGRTKLQASTSNIQRNPDVQAPKPNVRVVAWSLELGAFLDVGCWMLELPSWPFLEQFQAGRSELVLVRGLAHEQPFFKQQIHRAFDQNSHDAGSLVHPTVAVQF